MVAPIVAAAGKALAPLAKEVAVGVAMQAVASGVSRAGNAQEAEAAKVNAPRAEGKAAEKASGHSR